MGRGRGVFRVGRAAVGPVMGPAAAPMVAGRRAGSGSGWGGRGVGWRWWCRRGGGSASTRGGSSRGGTCTAAPGWTRRWARRRPSVGGDGVTLRRAHCKRRLFELLATAAGSMSTACSSTSPKASTSATQTAPEPQHRSTTTTGGWGARRTSAAAWRTRNSVRRRGTNTPGVTAIRRPQNSVQPRICSRGSPAARRSTRAARLVAVPAADISNGA